MAEPVLVQKLAVVLLVGVGLDGKGYASAPLGPVAVAYLVAVKALRDPHGGLFGPEGPRLHHHLGADHKGRVEAHAELTDYVNIRIVLLVLALELQGAALCDNPQVAVKLLRCHADAVVGDTECPAVLIHLYPDKEILPVKASDPLADALIVELVDSVAGVGDELSEEDLLMGVD